MKKDIKKNIKGQAMAISSVMDKPRIYIDEKMLPEIKEWEVGNEYDLMVKVRQVALRQEEDRELEATFEILSAKADE